MGYYFAKTVPGPFGAAVSAVREALKAEGFGVITEIDVQATLKAKVGAEFRPYLILGACNPSMAHQALQLEDKVGTMLPCNVVVQVTPSGEVEVAAMVEAVGGELVSGYFSLIFKVLLFHRFLKGGEI